MALSLNFTLTACSGAGHVHVTAATTGSLARSRTVTLRKTDLASTPTDDEIQTSVEVLLRLLIAQLSNKSNANVKSVIEAKTIDLTVVG